MGIFIVEILRFCRFSFTLLPKSNGKNGFHLKNLNKGIFPCHLNGFHDFKNTTFYSDSINDLPLLMEVEKPVAVNPDNQLREIALKNNWQIEDLL